MRRAINSNGEKVNVIRTVGLDWAKLKRDTYTCPGCKEEVIPVAFGALFVKRPHFKHKPGSDCSLAKPKGESAEHHTCKDWVEAFINARIANMGWVGAIVEQEWIIKLNEKERREIDVAIVVNGEAVEAHEIQYSYQSLEEYQRRTTEYNSLGIGVCWWLVKGRTDRPQNKAWLSDNSLRYGEIEIQRHEVDKWKTKKVTESWEVRNV